jgi:acetyl-CoA carboxylase biotin carboxyl carrier protein
MVGTFYSKPSPDEKPFVNEGDSIKAGDVVGLIDVMKLFTNIESSLNGKIKSILVNDGDVVEFDQPLIEIETS